MIKRIMTAIAAGLGLAAAVSIGQTTGSGIIVEPSGQATTQSCQSYVLALALAFKNDPAFRISTAADLRKAETDIREAIVARAAGADVNHDHVKKGFEDYTAGKYVLRIRDVDTAQLVDLSSQRTGVTSASQVPLNFLLRSVVKDVAISSATKIGSDSYANGHIFTILGVDGPPNSNQRVLLLNSAVKSGGTTRNACTPGLPDSPGPYTASATWRKVADIEFKKFGGKVKLWTVEKS
jgi:hypothetical protein